MEPVRGEKIENRDLLIGKLRREGQDALAELFSQNRARLRRMVEARLEDQLRARLDPSDVLQEAYMDASAQLESYLADPRKPPFLWLRFLVGQRLIAIYRWHLGAQKRDARRELPLCGQAMPDASSVWLSRELLDDLTSPSAVAARNETLRSLEQTLAGMDRLDREILSLRHYEELSNAEAAEELGITEAAASKRYVRAVRRLKEAAEASFGLQHG